MSTEGSPREVGSHAGLGLAPERAEVERLAVWMERAAWIDAAHSYHEYEQTAKALRGLLAALDAAVAAERERCATLCESLTIDAERLSGAETAGWLEQAAARIRA